MAGRCKVTGARTLNDHSSNGGSAAHELASRLTASERGRLVVAYNNTSAPYAAEQTIAGLFVAQVARTPEAEAIRFGDQSLTYRELNARVNQMAEHLQKLGVRPRQVVTIFMEHSIEVVCAMLAVLKAGGAYAPVDSATPKGRLTAILREIAGASGGEMPVLVTQSRLMNAVPADLARVVTLDAGFSAIEGYATTEPPPVAAPSDLAYVIFTSGSTGTPKGVMIEHRSLVNYVWWANARYGQGEPLAWPLFSSLAFDLTVTSIYTPLISGGRIVVYREDAGLHSMVIFKVVDDDAVDIVKLTPAHLAMIKDRNLRATRIRKLIVGGEDFKTELARDVTQAFGRPTELFNEYGPTEATVGCMIHRYDVDVDRANSVPIGTPAANAGVYVLDKSFQPVPTGVIGEMFVAGDGLARGYLNRPDLTEQRFVFVDDPRLDGTGVARGKQPQLRLYQTGDIARWTADGRLEFLGRIDHQVKVGGARIELGEIEAELLKHPDVRECVVDVVRSVSRKAPPGEEPAPTDETDIDRLVAYYVSAKSPSVAKLRAHLAQALPDYMVPPHFIRLDALPLTTNGKVDRRALPAPTTENLQLAHDFVRPNTETEKALTVIWTELLKVENIGVNDGFFDLGGHSLLAIRAASRIRDVFGVDIPLDVMFAKPTVSGLARVLGEASGSSGAITRIEHHSRNGPFPLSFAQEQLWFLDQLSPGNAFYNMVDVVAIEGTYHPEAMRRAMEELVRRHEVLRTVFSESSGHPTQVVLPAVDVTLPELDLAALQAEDRQREWARVAREQAREPFVLTSGPLVRAAVVHMSTREHRLLLTIHHIVADEWSLELIQQEVRQLYEAFSLGLPSPLPELPIQYAQFASWQRDWLQGDVLHRQVAHWKKELEGAQTVLELPADHPRPAVQRFCGATEVFEIPEHLLDQLKAIGREEDATLFMTLQACFMAFLHRYTGQDDILVGTPITGRTRSETERLIGYFVNMVVLRAQFTERLNFRALLKQLRDRALGAYAHPDLPLEHVVTELALERDASRTPLFQVMFILSNPDAVSQVSKVSGMRELDTGTSKVDLTMVLAENGDRFEGMIEYSTDLFEAETIRRVSGHFSSFLGSVVRSPDRAIAELPFITRAEREQQRAWNATSADVTAAGVHELIARQAGRTPARIAVECGGHVLSYADLDERSSRVADRLRAHGAGAGVRVGVFMERSLDMLVGLLGVLKSGAAYVPLDPAFPDERLSYMIEDSEASLVLSHTPMADAVPSHALPVILVDVHDDAPPARAGTPEVPAQPDDLAYVIYTSGSTGRPKGVAVSHRALVNLLESMAREPGFREEDVLLSVTTLSFDIAALELYLPLIQGGRVVLASRDDASDPEQLMERLASSRATVMQATPATWRMLVDSGWKGEANLRVLCGGEGLPRDLAESLLARVGALWNMYGPTETTVWSATGRVTSGVGPVSIGRPIANTQFWVLDGKLQPMPVGVPGELYIAGMGLASGYWKRPDLVAERFVPNPFAGESGARMYRTGDRGRWLPDGRLECLGRIDDQVKVRGFRIEPGEIEAVLREFDGVLGALVLAQDTSVSDRRLVAYVAHGTNPPMDEGELRAHLGRRLPSYMVPTAWVFLDALPLTPNGKVDRRALARLHMPEAVRQVEQAPPRTATEKLLAAIWQEVLAVPSLGIDQNFFKLGGNSLSAVRVMARARSKVGVNAGLRTLFERPTIAGLAEAIDALVLAQEPDAGVLATAGREEFELGE